MNVPRPGGECPRRAESEEEMTASNGIRTENKIKRLAAAVALAVMAILGISCLSPARADAAGTSDGNLVIDVPTTVPCALMADGTVVSPSEWKITTSGDAYIASASASGFPANVEWSAKTTDLAAAQAGSVRVAGTGDVASVSGPSDPAAAALAPSAGFEWSFSKLDAGKNSNIIGKAASGTAVLGSVTFTFAKAEPDSFAVYSADDNSLSFYKRADVPVADQMFEGKTATEVYTGLETMTSIPGWTQNHFNDIKTVMVYDKGIAPTGTAFWFAGVRNLKTADVSKLDMSRCKTIECMFTDCISLETLDLSGWDTSSLTSMSQAFHHCASLTKLNVSGWDVSKVTNMQLAFAEDKALGSLDLSTWDNSAVTSMKDAFSMMNSLSEVSLGSKFKFVGTSPFLPVQTGYVTGADGKWYDTDGNGYAPEDIPSNKAMTYTAVAPKKTFAVYSSDDQSLNFYKRSAVPAAGEQFEGKTATEVYEGVEKASYTAADGAPWAGHAAELVSVKVADAGISPVSTAYWFNGASKLRSVSLAGLDTSQTTCMDGMFQGCSSLDSLDLTNMSTRRVASMTAFLGGCDSLAELSLGSEFAWVDDDCFPPTGDWKQGSTGTDYSESDIPANKTDKYTRTKTAFAVYSADDNSLSFYKRISVPAAGEQFEGKVATEVFTGFETEAYGSSSSVPWAACQSNVITTTVADEGIAPRSTAMWFSNMTTLGSADISKLNTNKVTNMRDMFYGCESLTTLDLSSFDTSNVTDMSYMFFNCKALTTLDLTSFDTGNVTDMSWMFNACKALTSLDLSSFDTARLTKASVMFSGCTALTSLDLSSFDTSNVTSMSSMFADCESLTSLNLTSFDTGNVTGMYRMFGNCTALTTLDLTSFDTGNVTNMSWMFGNCKALTTLDLTSFNTANVANMSYMFKGCSALTPLDLSSFDTGKVTNMTDLLAACNSLERIDLGAGFKWVGQSCYPPAGNWESVSTGKAYSEKEIPTGVADAYVFKPKTTAFAVYSADDQSLTFYKRAGVPSAGNQFEGKTATEVYTGFETETYGLNNSAPWSAHYHRIETVVIADDGIAPKSTASWFKGFYSLRSADVSKLDMSKCKDVSYMFYECNALGSINISTWDTSSFENVSYMLGYCRSLRELDVLGWNVSNIANMEEVFFACSNVRTLDISTWDNSKTENMNLAFEGMSHLEKIKLGDKFNWIGDGPRLPYPNDEFIPTAMTTKWYAESTGAEYSPENIPSLKADTYYASKALRDAAVGATSDPVDDDSTAVPAVASTCKAQGESATQKAVEGVPPLEGKASKESDTATKPEGVEKDAEGKPAVENEATKEDISAIVPEGAEKATVKKSGE